jgi:putative oxidoreductase
MKESLSQLRSLALERVGSVEPLGPLLARLSVGAVFLESGMGKLAHLDRTTDFFRELGIVAPEFHARFVSGLEVVGGVGIALGLCTRLLSLPLAGTMVVAVWTAQWAEVHGVLSFFSLTEVTLFCVLMWLALTGPGRWSLDSWLVRRWLTSAAPAEPLARGGSAPPDAFVGP